MTDMTNTANGLRLDGKPVDLIEFAGTVLMIFFLSCALCAGLLEVIGLSEETAERLCVLVMPGLITLVMAVRVTVRIARAMLAAFRWAMKLVRRLTRRLSSNRP